jgi:hypothetical protein
MEHFAIGANLESAAARWDERKRLDAFAEFKNFGRQTDGLRRVVSNDAIFDRDFRLHSVSSFPSENPTGWTKPVKRPDRGGESDAQQAVRITLNSYARALSADRQIVWSGRLITDYGSKLALRHQPLCRARPVPTGKKPLRTIP